MADLSSPTGSSWDWQGSPVQVQQFSVAMVRSSLSIPSNCTRLLEPTAESQTHTLVTVLVTVLPPSLSLFCTLHILVNYSHNKRYRAKCYDSHKNVVHCYLNVSGQCKVKLSNITILFLFWGSILKETNWHGHQMGFSAILLDIWEGSLGENWWGFLGGGMIPLAERRALTWLLCFYPQMYHTKPTHSLHS